VEERKELYTTNNREKETPSDAEGRTNAEDETKHQKHSPDSYQNKKGNSSMEERNKGNELKHHHTTEF
jgi:hypothetical protein